MKIGELAKSTGVPIDTVRYYERHGILPTPRRRPSGYRSYDEGDRARLRFIRRAKALGFTLEEIRDLLALTARRGRNMAGVKRAASGKLADVEHKLADLVRVRDGLRALVDACPGHGDLAQCPILAALSGEES
ncbi:MAG: Mercuric resistance operon regulatory protein [Steroidobacteraceae bacterium]|nr:Mercuric resistance operon regulatory protein [Steroidobacteraceae bacterium]